eukprot:SAG11_NODE_26245_length_347_cov_7.818548_2_plen_77_part_01
MHLVPEDHGKQSVRNRAIKICTVEYKNGKKVQIFFNYVIYIMPSRQEILKMKARYAANPLDYKKVIVERSFAKDWKP